MGDRKHQDDACYTHAPRAQQSDHSAALTDCSADHVLGKPAVDSAHNLFTVDQRSLSFATAVGHQTVFLDLRVANRSQVALVVKAHIEGPAAADFDLQQADDIVQPHSDEGLDNGKDFSVRYTPKSAGHHEATLVLTSDGGGEERVQLAGTAVVSHAPAEAAGQISEVTLPEHSSRAHGQDERGVALERLSVLAERYQAVVTANDAKRDAAEKRMIAAVRDLNRRVLTWLQKEGVHLMKESREDESGAGEIVKAFLTKGLEAGLEHFLELGGLPLAATMFALELGGGIKSAADANNEAREAADRYAEVTSVASELGVQAQDVATSALMHRYGAVLSQYSAKRAEAHAIAGSEAMEAIGDLQHVDPRSPEEPYFYEKARSITDRFRAAADGWGAAIGNMEHAASVAEHAVATGYSALLQRYLMFRMERAREENMPKLRALAGIPIEKVRPDLEDLEEVIVDGGISFADPPNIQLNSFRFGAYENMSDEMRTFASSQMIRQLDEVPVEIRLFAAEGGRVVIRKPRQSTRYSIEAEAEAKAYVGRIGEERLWQTVAGATLMPKVLRIV